MIQTITIKATCVSAVAEHYFSKTSGWRATCGTPKIALCECALRVYKYSMYY